MTTKIESDFPSSPQNDESDGEEHGIENNQEEEEEREEEEEQEGVEEKEVEEEQEREEEKEEEEEQEGEEDRAEDSENPQQDVASLLARLQSSGALIKKPKQEYRCFSCDIDFSDWEELENHLIEHVSLPSVVLDKLPSDEEDLPNSGDENWSDEDDDPNPPKQSAAKAPQKIDISQILKKTGISLKKKGDDNKNPDSALNKLSGLGFTITKNSTPIKKENQDNDSDKNNDVMQKLGKLGGIKLKLKSDGNNTNSFKVVNGLKDFKASDDEDEGSGNDEDKDEEDDDVNDKSNENDGSAGEQDSDDNQSNKRSRSNSGETDKRKIKQINLPKGIQGKLVVPKKEPVSTPTKAAPVKIQQEEAKPKGKPGRPPIKQTPKRGVAPAVKELPKKEPPKKEAPVTRRSSRTAVTPERRQSKEHENVENVVVKQEVPDTVSSETQNNTPLFTGQIKSERASPPLADRTTPILAHVKTEPEVPSVNTPTTPTISEPVNEIKHTANLNTAPLLPVTKTEDTGVTIIEINGDSNDEDDDCCVVSTTPAPDIKPIIPKIEKTIAPPAYPTTPQTVYATSQPSYNSSSSISSRLSSAPSTEKQHNFNWNAPDSKPPIDMLEKSADDIFESLLSTKKESMSISDASEYVSLDTLGPQHTCDICNTRFTDILLLEDHRRMTGHSKSLVSPASTSLMPYNQSSNILSSLLPVKQLAEQVGKLSTISNSSSAGFTHQQNVMINIQAYPGAGGVMVPPQYNAYASGQNVHSSYPQTANNMYGSPGHGQSMNNQYHSPSNYMNQPYPQYPSPSKATYPGAMPNSPYTMASSPYSTASPLQSMQQAVYGQSPSGVMNPPGAMGPPGTSPSHSYAPSSSPGGMKQPPGSGIKIQNIQTFPPNPMMGAPGLPGQLAPGSDLGQGQMPPPQGPTMAPQIPTSGTPIRMSPSANIAGARPRLPSLRGQRPTIRPGIQVHGQVRGAKVGPRMPLKRPGTMVGGPGQKRRNDMLLPGKHDNEDCQVMAMQKQRDGLPMIQSVQGAKDKLNLGGQISITKKTVNKEASAMANVLASRGISVKQKQKSRSPTPDRPIPHIPNLGAGMSIKHTSKYSKFSIPEAKVGGGMYACKICKKMFMNHTSLQVHLSNAHPSSKIPVFKCDECPASYPKTLQLQHHKRVFHNVTGPNRELGLPVVDLSQEDNLKRLSNLGIYSFIPLANREQANGCFGIPVISVHNMQNGLTSSLQALGADGLLSLGPLKPLPNS